LASSKGKAIDVGLMSPYFVKHFKKKMKNALKKRRGRITSTLGQEKYFLRYLPLTGGMGKDLDDP
jgi:hypothetical protein